MTPESHDAAMEAILRDIEATREAIRKEPQRHALQKHLATQEARFDAMFEKWLLGINPS